MTVAINASSTLNITGLNLDETLFKTDKKIADEEITKLLEVNIANK